MKNRRNYIKENRIILDDQEPDEGHFDRFEERLNRSIENKNNAKRKFIQAFSIAASVALLVWAGIRFYPSPVAEKSDESDVFLLTNDFYQGQMNEEIAGIQCKLEKANTKVRNQLEKDLQHIIEENDSFVEQIHNDENEELAVFYLMKHYKINLQALRFINHKLGNYIEC
jgi:hypothetical protein